MLYQYHCACCNKVLTSITKECPQCGSHHIKSPINLWILCVSACLVVVLTFKLAHMYIQDRQDTPVQPTMFDVLNGEKNTSPPK
ncbi:hypothetical protein EC844_11013 [Acinetobacter calcoaceticus]|uniref:Uncharacterized protein n=1 Tax=Acinetobacter calcoaceticus TaxID=471 RepID=A0A4R1XUN6_ACICA|nr:hypothetical protein EC844_11013 [Acinetobacter calcoaceticus]